MLSQKYSENELRVLQEGFEPVIFPIRMFYHGAKKDNTPYLDFPKHSKVNVLVKAGYILEQAKTD